MWNKIVRYILKNRFWNILVIGLLTLLMAYFATRVTMTYEMARMLPETDETYIISQNFKKQFGGDGSIMFVGVCDDRLYDLNNYRQWHTLNEEIRQIDGVQNVFSLSNAFNLVKDNDKKSFVLTPAIAALPLSQESLDSSMNLLFNLPIYDGLLYNKDTKATIMMIFFDNKKVDSKDRDALCYKIRDYCAYFSGKTGIEVHLSGMPFIRTVTSQKIKSELFLFLFLAIVVATLALFLFFRSWQAVLFPLIVVLVSVIWAVGFMGIMGYQITVLTAIIPPLLIIIGVENSIFLINKYHAEYRKHGNKILALSRAISRIGKANILTNLTTAIGFLAFVVTQNANLVEFGFIASVSILVAYVLTIILLPTFFTYARPPKPHETVHLENKTISKVLALIEDIVRRKRGYVYLCMIVVICISLGGMTKLKISGRIVDDIPHKEKLYTDLLFLEHHFKGILPLEIMIDAKKDKEILRLPFLNKMNELQEVLAEYDELAKPLSLVEFVKFGKQAYYNGNPNYYSMPNNHELAFIMGYLPQLNNPDELSGAGNLLRILVDSSFSKTRMSIQMQNIGTNEIERIKNELQPKIDEIFDPGKYDVELTGSGMVFLKGTNYLTHNLMQSLVLALLCISFVLFCLFKSWRMLLVALITNIIPLLFTAGMMGYLNIPIKMSSILVFSIALGISVDNTIHFLSRYRLEVRINSNNIKKAVIFTLGEAGYSMIYSSIILFLGFSLFSFSTFGGIKIVGLLVAQTLLFALISNLFLLPSLLMWMDKSKREKNISQHKKLQR